MGNPAWPAWVPGLAGIRSWPDQLCPGSRHPGTGHFGVSMNSLFIETERFRIPYVSYNPEAGTKNVLSVSQLAEDHDLDVVFEPTCCYVRDSATGKDVGRGRVLNGTYVLDSLLIGQPQVLILK